MIIAYYSRNFPFIAYFLPDMYKSEGAAVLFSILNMTKPMGTNLNGSVVFNRIYFKTTGHQVSSQTIIFSGSVLQTLYSIFITGQSSFVMVKLQVSSK